MKELIVKGENFEAHTNDFDIALRTYEHHNCPGHSVVVEDGDTGEVLMQGENGNTTYIDRALLMAMLDVIADDDPRTATILLLGAFAVGALD